MNSQQKDIHHRALAIAAKYHQVEFALIQILQEVDRFKIHRAMHHRSLFQYAIKELRLSEPVALSFISVARKSKEVVELKKALKDGAITVSSASRLVSTIHSANASHLIEFACTHTWRETERELAKHNPCRPEVDRMKAVSEEITQLLVHLTSDDLKKFERVASLEAQRSGKSPGKLEVLRASLNSYLEKNDPILRAERVEKKRRHRSMKAMAKTESEAAAGNVKMGVTTLSVNSENSVRAEQISVSRSQRKEEASYKRTPLTAEQRNEVFKRDQGRCTHIDHTGKRCNSDRWTEIHHIVRVCDGGTNHPSNLTTLCSFHHDLVHQLSLPIDGQVTWLRSRQVQYGLTGCSKSPAPFRLPSAALEFSSEVRRRS